MKLIAFTGKKGWGKDTAADFLTNHGFIKESFAKRMKKGVQVMLDLTDAQVDGTLEEKEEIIVGLSNERPVSGRHILQTIGTEWGRNMVDSDIWIYPVDKVWRELQEDSVLTNTFHTGLVISDLRFNNEAEWVKSQGGSIIYVKAPGDEPDVDGHESEQGIDMEYVDYTITNYKRDKEEFYDQILDAMDHISLKKTLPSDKESIKDLIVDWANEVFPQRDINNAIQKMVLEEIPEYLTSQHDPMELADVAILLYDIAHLAGIDLEKAVREKMVINKKRSWTINKSTGLMEHVK